MKYLDLRHPKFRFFGIITLVSLAFTFMFLVFPWWGDDIWYMQPLKDYINGSDKTFPWDGLFSCWEYHYLKDNIRTANIVLTFFLLIPKWVSSILSGVMVWLTLYYAAKLVKLKYDNTGWLLLCTLLTIFLPWEDFLIVSCYTLNYIWAAALSLIAIDLFLSDKKYNPILIFIFGIIFGSWHEGFSGPVLAGFAGWMILNRHKLTLNRWLLCIGICIGILWLASAPGIHHYSKELNGFSRLFLLSCIPFVLFIISIISILAAKRIKLLFDNTPIILSVAGLAGMCLLFISPYLSGRIICFANLVFTIVSIFFAKELFAQTSIQPLIKNVSITLLSIFLCVHLVVSCYFTLVISNEYDNVVEEYKKSDDGTVFVPLTLAEDIPIICLRKPIRRMYGGFYTQCVDSAYSDGYKRLRVIPIELKEYSVGKGSRIDGNLNIELYKNRFVGPILNPERPDSIEVRFNTKLGGIGNIFFRTEFQGKDGENYYYYFPEHLCVPQWLGIHIKEINAVESDFQ